METLSNCVFGESLGDALLSIISGTEKNLLIYKKYDKYRDISRKDALNLCESFLNVLSFLKFKKTDKILFISENRYELVLSILASVLGGYAVIPIDYRYNSEQIALIIKNANPKCIVFSNEKQFEKIEQLEDINKIPLISFENVSNNILLWKDLIKKHKKQNLTLNSLKETVSKLSSQSIAFTLYEFNCDKTLKINSLTHKEIIFSIKNFIKELNLKNKEITNLAYLPFGYCFGVIQELFTVLLCGGTYSIAENSDIDNLLSNLKESRSTIFFGVPRTWEKLYEICQNKNNLLELDLKIGFCAGNLRQKEIHDFFNSNGITIHECLGMPELAGAIAIKTNNHPKWQLLKGINAKTNDDGEIIIQKDETNWIKTGYLGLIDKYNMLILFGNKEEFITLSTGHKIFPEKIENMFVNNLISQIIIIGDNQKYPAALIVPDFKNLLEYAKKELKIEYNSLKELINNNWIKAIYKLLIEETNENLSYYERIRGFSILENPFTFESMELTASNKLIRSVISIKREKEIQNIYKTSFFRNFLK